MQNKFHSKRHGIESEDEKDGGLPSFLLELDVEEEILVLSDEDVVKCKEKILQANSQAITGPSGVNSVSKVGDNITKEKKVY